MDSTPLVCITGQVRTHLIGTDAFQECDIVGVTIPIVKHSWLVQDVGEIPHVLKAAFHVARTGRCGPVLVDIPRDVQEAEIDFEYPDEPDLPGWRPPRRVNARQVAAAAATLAAAEKPVLYVGGGVLNADACAELLGLAETARVPVVTTLMAKGAFLETLRDLTAGRDDVIWTTGVGQHQMWAMQYLVCDRPRTFVTSGGLGTMGYGLPAAVGAKAARPDATVVCVDGDGCFQMTCQELATAVLEDLPIVVVIVNNGWLGMVRQWQEMFYAERFAETHLTHQVPDYARLAEAYGAAGFTVAEDDELESALEQALSCGRTAVVDVHCDPEEKCFPMIPAGAAATDMLEFDASQVPVD